MLPARTNNQVGGNRDSGFTCALHCFQQPDCVDLTFTYYHAIYCPYGVFKDFISSKTGPLNSCENEAFRV